MPDATVAGAMSEPQFAALVDAIAADPDRRDAADRLCCAKITRSTPSAARRRSSGCAAGSCSPWRAPGCRTPRWSSCSKSSTPAPIPIWSRRPLARLRSYPRPDAASRAVRDARARQHPLSRRARVVRGLWRIRGRRPPAPAPSASCSRRWRGSARTRAAFSRSSRRCARRPAGFRASCGSTSTAPCRRSATRDRRR